MRTGMAAAPLAALLIVPTSPQAQDIKGQKPVLIVDGAFQFTPGSWASYVIHRKDTDEYYAFRMSVLNDETRRGRQGTWLEIDMDTGKERVVTRVLAEKTPGGPGELIAGIVWIEGLAPFSVPEKYLSDDEKEVGQFQVAHATKRVEARSFIHDGRPLRGYLAELADDAGGVTRALLSTDVAPMGVVWVDAPDTEMYLNDWGGGAETLMKGRPVSMWLWAMDLVARGVSGDEAIIPERKLPAPVIDGAWEEQDGTCAGSLWTVRVADGVRRSAESVARCTGGTGPEILQVPEWKTPRIVVGQLESSIRKGAAQFMFVSDTRAILAVRAPDGSPAVFSVLRKTQ